MKVVQTFLVCLTAVVFSNQSEVPPSEDHSNVIALTRCNSYSLNALETTLSTMDAKLKKVENMDEVIQEVLAKIDSTERTFVSNLQLILDRLDSLENSCSDDGDSILEDNETDLVPEPPARRFRSRSRVVKTPSRQRKRRLVRKPASVTSAEVQGAGKMEKLLDASDRMLEMITEVHNAIFENTAELAKRRKSDSVFSKMEPLLQVEEKFDEFKAMLEGTKSVVEHLIPKSEELLNQTMRQERVISQMKSDLEERTNAIMFEITEVTKELNKTEQKVEVPVSREMRRFEQSIISQPEITPQKTFTTATTTITRLSTVIENIPEAKMRMRSTTPALRVTTKTSTSTTTSTTTTPKVAHTNATIQSPRMKDSNFTTIMMKQLLNQVQPTKATNVSTTTPRSPATISLIDDQVEKTTFSCADLKTNISGVYSIEIDTKTWVKVFCDMETVGGGWTVIQRRDDFGEKFRENFNRDWSNYKNGFGEPDREFWLGNENIHLLTKNDNFELRIELDDFDGNRRYAEYKHFKLASELEDYRLEIGGYSGNAGDALNDPWYGSNQRPFSTFDRDNDRSSLNCASMLKGGWWWKSCGRGLNGIYLTDPQDLSARQGIVWFRWRGWDYSLKRTRMMIRPKNFNVEEVNQN